jgi:hypothetical protein
MTENPATSPGDRSCKACSKAKRKCDKRLPACRRCTAKRQCCIYPPSKPTCFVPLHTPAAAPSPPEPVSLHISAGALSEPQALEWGAFTNDLDLSAFLTPIVPNMQLSITESALGGLYGAWFLSPETWVVVHTSIPLPPNFEMIDLKGFLRLIEEWLETWTITGSNLFIHAKLYRDQFPACVQVAYTTLSTYTNKKADNTDTILRIVNERAQELVTTIKSTPIHLLDIFELLAHVHALFVYQVIGLLDGDIRSRHLAEQHSSIFVRLLNEMLEFASKSLAQSLMGCEIKNMMTSVPDHRDTRKSVWRAWIMSESIRRTWLVGMGLNAAYDGLKQGWTPCPGDIPFTSAKGLWTAAPADMWDSLCAETNVHFTQRFHAAWLFRDADPNEVDDFGKMMLQITYGKERVQEWLDRGQI